MTEKPPKRQREKTSTPDKGNNHCVTCKKKVTIKDDGVECQWCEKWEHKICAKLSDDEYKILSDSSPHIIFFCSSCFPKVPSALSDYTSQTIANFDSRLKEMESKLSGIFEDINAKLDDHYKKLEEKFVCRADDNMDSSPSPNAKTISDSVAPLTASLVTEQKEREKRELNLVLHNVPEPTTTDNSARKEEDITQVNSILSGYLDVKPTIKNAVRLGKKVTDKARLLKITVASTQEKARVLRNKLKLRKESNPEDVKKIFITPDFTSLEQKRTRPSENNFQR